MIEVANLTRRYQSFTAVDQVSFQIQRGEIVGLLGHNGAGKSTIMKMLTGFLEPNSGTIRIDGHELQTDRSFAQAKIGYLPENCPVYPDMSVIDFLDYTATLRGLPEGERSQAIRRVIKQTDLSAKATAPISTLSRGYRQRVGVAQALLHKPEILILDEPTNGLDPGQIEHMRELIRELGKNSTVIVSTHIMQEVEATCDRVLILRQGRLALDSKLDELTRGSGLLLTCNATEEQVQSQLQPIAAISKLGLFSETGPANTYRIDVTSDFTKTSAEIAKAIIVAGWDLYSLQPEERSLEKVFHEINDKEVIDDAA